MRPLGIVPVNPLSNGSTGFGEAGEIMLPDAFLLEAAKETFDDAVLLGRVGGDDSWRSRASRQAARKRRLWKIRPLSLRTTGVGPSGRSVPNRARQASSSARSVSFARPRKANSKP